MLDHAKKIHCIGIGGIGVSALAALWRAQGKQVSGSDADTGGHRAENVRDVDLVVYSDAVPEDNIERVEARRRGISQLSYAQALGQVSREYKTIVVTGTHGKSTTTAMLGLILESAGFDPLVLVGSKVPGWPLGNLRLPKNQDYANGLRPANDTNKIYSDNLRPKAFASSFLIVEGDDYRDHFLELQPYAVVVTSIEWDHPDYFRDLEHTIESFTALAEKVSKDGFVILNGDDAGCKRLAQSLSRTTGRLSGYGNSSDIFFKLQLRVPGEFNRYNATAAATAARELGVAEEVAQKTLAAFKGIWRRFEVIGEYEGATIISDYAHHPTAIRETMKAAREAYPDRRLVLVYQPHQHSRTKHLFKDFVEVLKDAADVVIVSEIYAVKGRMEDRDVNSQMLVDEITKLRNHEIANVLYGGNLEETKRVVLEQIKPGDVVILMGAGDIDSLAREMILPTC